MKMEYERDLSDMKLTSLKGVRQDKVTSKLAERLGISRQSMRRILIKHCDIMTLENLGQRLTAADNKYSPDSLEYALSIPHLTAAAGILSEESALKYLKNAEIAIKSGAVRDKVIKDTLKEIISEISS